MSTDVTIPGREKISYAVSANVKNTIIALVVFNLSSNISFQGKSYFNMKYEAIIKKFLL